MARVAGIEIPNDKRLWVPLMSIYGIGEVTAKKICNGANVKEGEVVKDLSETELDRVRKYIEENFSVEGELRQERFRDIKRLKDMRS